MTRLIFTLLALLLSLSSPAMGANGDFCPSSIAVTGGVLQVGGNSMAQFLQGYRSVPAFTPTLTPLASPLKPSAPVFAPQPVIAAKEGGSLTRLKNWWNTGSEADGAWRALPLKDKAFYEIGQKTLPGKTFENYATLDPVARGRALVNDLGWPRAIWPQGTGYRLGVGTTLPTGPTPLVRWAVPRAAGAAGAGAAAGAGYYFFNSED